LILYELYITEKAQKQLDKLKKKAKIRWDAIQELLKKMREDPFIDTLELQDPLFKKLRRAKTEDDRIFFQICENCRSNSTIMKLRQCIDCADIPENGIKIFETDVRNNVYDKHKKR